MINFEDISILTSYSEVNSRKEVDISSTVAGVNLRVPIISSPSASITEAYMANAIYTKGGLGIIHRYNTVKFQKKLLDFLNHNTPKAAAIGLNEDALVRLDTLAAAGLQIACIDTTFSFSLKMRNIVHYIKENYPDIKIIASNCSSIDHYNFLIDLEVDAIRLGFGNGACSTTKEAIGITTTSSQLLHEIKINKLKKEEVTLIADGGHRNTSDIVKSIALGADVVCLGKMLASSKEASTKYIVEEFGKNYKKMIGNGSKLNQTIYRGKYNTIEGKDIKIDSKNTLQKTIYEVSSALKSTMSYCGANNIKEFQEKVKIKIKGI